MTGTTRRHVVITGHVQGVFFRDSCSAEAQRLGVSGFVRNLSNGRVEAAFEGPAEDVDALVSWCRNGPRRAHVSSVQVTDEDPVGEKGFRVLW